MQYFLFREFLWFLHVQDAVENNIPELHPPLHGEVRPVQIGGEEDEADTMFWMPVENWTSDSHEAVPAFHVLTGVSNIIISLVFFINCHLLVIEGIQSTLGDVGSNSKIIRSSIYSFL